MFTSTKTAMRIERAEVATTRAMAEPVIASGRAPDGFVRPLGAGVASYVRPSSPMNKIIGAGVDAPIDEAALAEIEAALRARGEPARVELSTLAIPETGAWLTARGYRLLGFENVLVRPLSAASVALVPGVRVERVTAATVGAWAQTTIDAFLASDDTGVPVDAPTRAAVVAVMEDILEARDFVRYLAFTGGALAGGARMRVHDGIASLTGSATLPAHRRRGVQAALIAARLEDAHADGAELAVIITAPGSQSQANVMKHGFALAYARAILVA